MTCYFLCWEFGVHHINVETSKKDFHRVIDDMSTEFEIHKIYDNIDCPGAVFYYIENYYGELTQIGFSFKVNEVKK